MFIWVALNENVQQAKMLWKIIETCLHPKSLLELQRSYLVLRNLAQTFPHGPAIWKVMQRNAWNDIANLRTKQLNNKTKSQLHALTTTNSRKKILSKVCSQMVLECLSLARIGGPDIPWSVNKLGRAVTKWARTCDRRLARSISYIHHTYEFKQCCQVGNTAQQCRLRLFQDSDFARDLED